MSFNLPSVKPKPGPNDQFKYFEGSYGVPDMMKNGLAGVNTLLESVHPVAQTEQCYRQNIDNMNMVMLRNTQGLHAPLRIMMELKSARKIGHLPFLKSSNIMYESLTGRDLEIMPEDIFGQPECHEIAGQPHAVVEKSLGIL